MTEPDPRRSIPGTDRILSRPWCRELIAEHGHRWVAGRVREVVAELRARGGPGATAGGELGGSNPDGLAALVRERVQAVAAPSLRRVVNATGVVLHTNLGRAPLADEAREAMAAAAGFGNLDLDLKSGRRGSRHRHCVNLVREVTGAEDALVVNNNAGAVALALTACAAGRGVAVSHGELVEIGGGFRIPEVIEAAGAKLVAVGTTNRTRRGDYEAAARAGGLAAVLKVHRSNFSMSGFAEDTGLAELVAVGAAHGIPVIHDLGSGLLADAGLFGLPDEPAPAASVAAGADLVAFSGDKLLGGPQAGLLAGTADAVGRARAHPLSRALRCDKVTLAGLEATLALYRDPQRAIRRIPVLRMLRTPARELERRSREVLAGADDAAGPGGAGAATLVLGARVAAGESLVGGGTFPDARIPSAVISLRSGARAERWLARLRRHDPPVIARRARGRVLLDLRAVPPPEDKVVAAALAVVAALEARGGDSMATDRAS